MKKTGRVLRYLMAMVLMAVSLQASAETQTPAAEFNHATTGFALTGGHATAACETCHIGGVFKGTPRNCDGCHALGKRVVATPKSSSHIVTDAPCETCHFNSSTWLGARFNHGTAQPGSCQTCHNGRLSMSKPSSHNIGSKASNSCDQCHRTYAWLPASWNHGAIAAPCSSCHVSSPEVSVANRKPIGHSPTLLKGQLECDSCHSYIAWYPNRFKHNTGGACSSCHLNGVKAVGQPASHSGFTGWPTECSECHFTTTTWAGALGAKPSNHIPYNTGLVCSSCHVSAMTGVALHTRLSSFACTTCHLRGNAYVGWGQDTKSVGHEGMQSGDDCSKSGCHAPAGGRGAAYIRWD